MLIRLTCIGIVLSTLVPIASRAEDTNAQFAVKGVGAASCGDFLEASRQGTDNYYVYAGWIEGYISALNQTLKETYDLSPWQSTDLLATLVGRHCGTKTNLSFFRAVADVVADLKFQRLQHRSTLVEIHIGQQRIHLYADTIKSIQERLKALGFYSGTSGRSYDMPTQEAMAAYQKTKKLAETGFPDQITLLRLFY
jgi:hypothetical protein